MSLATVTKKWDENEDKENEKTFLLKNIRFSLKNKEIANDNPDQLCKLP